MAFEIASLVVQIAIFLVLSVFLYALNKPTSEPKPARRFSLPKPYKEPLKPHFMSDQEAYEQEMKEREEGQ